MLWGVILSPFIFIFTLVTLASFEFFGPLPTFDQLENPKNNLATEVISADSVVIGKFFIENRTSAKKEGRCHASCRTGRGWGTRMGPGSPRRTT